MPPEQELYTVANTVVAGMGAEVVVTYKGRGPFIGRVVNVRNIDKGIATITFLWDRGTGVAVMTIPHKSMLAKDSLTGTHWELLGE